MLNIGPQELILVLIIALVVVGPARLPELGRSIGKALREFRKVQDEVKDTFKATMNDDTPTRVTPRPTPHAPPTARSDGAPTEAPATDGVATDAGPAAPAGADDAVTEGTADPSP